MRLDSTGKVALTDIYNRPDPRDYFCKLRDLNYSIPQSAKPFFWKIFEAYREVHGTQLRKVVDIGCSYGINAALLKYDASMDELYNRYGKQAASLTREALLERDRALVQSRDRLPDVRFVGLDVSQQALDYAQAAGLLDVAVSADLEHNDVDPEMQRALRGSDVVISTGCVGYVTEKTFARVIAASGSRRPWLANFVLRMFTFDRISEVLNDFDYETIATNTLVKQRRFASAAEREGILDSLAKAQVDPTGYESEGWLYARLYVSIPRASRASSLVSALCA